MIIAPDQRENQTEKNTKKSKKSLTKKNSSFHMSSLFDIRSNL